MKDQILSNLNSPENLESLYRNNREEFRNSFFDLAPQIEDQKLVTFWEARLTFKKEETSWGNLQDLVLIIAASLIAGMIAKIPAIFGIDEDYFYPRNIGFIVFPFLTAYFAWRNKLPGRKHIFLVGVMIISAIFINMLPGAEESDTLILSCVHLLLFLWSILGFAFVGTRRNDNEKRLGFLRFNGDLIVISALLGIAGGILSVITLGLFSLIGLEIENFYFENIAVFGLAAIPILGAYLTQTSPGLVGKVSPVIARIFSPLVLVMLVIYLIAMAYSGQDPYNDREFLLIFNALLIGVMAIICFSVAETTKSTRSNLEHWILFLLSLVTIIVNGIALSAILFRISEWGITPNRAAVLGGNILILINLLMVSYELYRMTWNRSSHYEVGKAITRYLPIYFIWAGIVTFLFPFLFGFR